MEFAAAAMAAMATTAAEVGTVAAATASSVGTALTGATAAFGAPAIPGLLSGVGSSIGSAASILSGGATVLSVLNAQRSGEMKERALNLQADDADVTAQLESIQGTDRRSSLKAQLTQAIGDRDVAAAASGVDLSFGTPATARRQAQVDGERALSIDSNTTDFRIARLRERAAGYRAQAAGASAAGLGTAAAAALSGGASLLRRG